jgi:hypothetical protein
LLFWQYRLPRVSGCLAGSLLQTKNKKAGAMHRLFFLNPN